ncbi:MAG: F0F1 ATP synthase subunit epsilon [Armatimonadetes bacterium]|nr:F0F1 ATP synthase subunit epsilon [Armatimonadota bacterium]
MADKTFTLEVITPDRVVLSDREIASVVLPGVEGYLGVLANHAPLMTALKLGQLDYRKGDGRVDAMALTGGFVEVFENKVTVLADSAELREEIDIERAESAVKRAEERLAAPSEDIDTDRAQVALQRAMNRLNVARKQF